MYRQPVEIQGQNAAGKEFADSPEDVGGDEGHDGMIGTWEDFGHDTTRGRCDNGRDNRKKKRSSDVLEIWPMTVHDDEWHADASGKRQPYINPPEHPGGVDKPLSPVRASKDHHVDDGCRSVSRAGLASRMNSKPKIRRKREKKKKNSLAKAMGKHPRNRD